MRHSPKSFHQSSSTRNRSGRPSSLGLGDEIPDGRARPIVDLDGPTIYAGIEIANTPRVIVESQAHSVDQVIVEVVYDEAGSLESMRTTTYYKKNSEDSLQVVASTTESGDCELGILGFLEGFASRHRSRSPSRRVRPDDPNPTSTATTATPPTETRDEVLNRL